MVEVGVAQDERVRRGVIGAFRGLVALQVVAPVPAGRVGDRRRRVGVVDAVGRERVLAVAAVERRHHVERQQVAELAEGARLEELLVEAALFAEADPKSRRTAVEAPWTWMRLPPMVETAPWGVIVNDISYPSNPRSCSPSSVI